MLVRCLGRKKSQRQHKRHHQPQSVDHYDHGLDETYLA